MMDLKEIAAKVLGISIDRVTDGLERNENEEWDSLNHLLLISEIEKDMKIKFTIAEVEKIKTFKELKEIVLGKGGKK